MPTLIATRLRARLMSLALLGGCATAAAVPADPPAEDTGGTSAEQPAATTSASKRPDQPAVTFSPRNPTALGVMLVLWDLLPAGAERDELARQIDKYAGQRYATVSRLFWYTDLTDARAAAAEQKKPILALRMLGRLDEELSCANSRLFRTTLYANTEVSAFLRENFILYWSSEREVPRVTIDFGDGRKIESTTTGNSAHYILAADGTVVDVLPGLYAPKAFQAELTKTLAFTRTLHKLGSKGRADAITEYHRKAIRDATRTWEQLLAIPYLEDRGLLHSKGEVETALALAQRATISKAYIEVPALARIALASNPGELLDATTDAWAVIGQYAWQIGDAFPKRRYTGSVDVTFVPRPWRDVVAFRPREIPEGALGPVDLKRLPKVLDPASRTLVTALHEASPMKTTEPQRDLVIARLEHHLVADSALNEFKLRTQIHRHLAKQKDLSFDAVNTFVYAEVFHTPRQDAWLGLLPRTDFTGLPGDGVVMP